MKVSIITVCFNSSKTLEKTIQSVAKQTYNNIEYIIVDGKSTDQTVEIIRKYEGVVSRWVSECDNGLYDAINKGITRATGDLIGILNSDDILYSDSTIAEVVNFHLRNDIEASVGNIIQRNVMGNNVRFYSSKYWSPNKLIFGFMPPHPSIFISRFVFGKYGMYDICY